MKNIAIAFLLFALILNFSSCEKNIEADQTVQIEESSLTFQDDVEILSSKRNKQLCCNVTLDQDWSQSLTDLRGKPWVKVTDIRFPSRLAYARINYYKENESTGAFEKVYTWQTNSPNKASCTVIRTGFGVGNFGPYTTILPGTYKIEVAVATGQYVPCCPSLPGSPAPYYVEQICDSASVIVELD